MCLAIPAKLVEINENQGKVDLGGALVTVGLDLLDNFKIGDYLIIHAGFALERLDEDEAKIRLELFDELARKGGPRA